MYATFDMVTCWDPETTSVHFLENLEKVDELLESAAFTPHPPSMVSSRDFGIVNTDSNIVSVEFHLVST